MVSRSGLFRDAIPKECRMRFTTAESIRRSGTQEALRFRNFDRSLQKEIETEVSKRTTLLGEKNKLPANSTSVEAEALFKEQQIMLEMGNRVSPNEFNPTSRKDMLAFTKGMLPKEDPRNQDGGKFLFVSPQDFLAAYEDGLQRIKEEGMCGMIPVGGAGTRAAKELPKYEDYAKKYRITSDTPRCLYPIPGADATFLGLAANIIRMFGNRVGRETPLFLMTTSSTANHFIHFVRSGPEAADWEDDVLFWNQRVVKRYDVAGLKVPLEEDYPAGHGDNAILGYQYGILQAMKNLGIKLVASSNSDEFLWYYLYPALTAKMNSLEASMFAITIANANNQMGGFFANNKLIETPRIPYSYIETGKAPEVLNSTFYGMTVDTLIKGAEALRNIPRALNLVTKATWVNSGGNKKLINMIGVDSWMGDEFSEMTLAGGGKFEVWESPRNLFLGMKGPQQAANFDPQPFLGGLSYSKFYEMMAHKVKAVLNVLLGNDKNAKEKMAEQLFRNNFELINVKI